MKKDRRMFVLMFVSSFALASVVGYVGIASAQNMSAGSNMTSNATMGTTQMTQVLELPRSLKT